MKPRVRAFLTAGALAFLGSSFWALPGTRAQEPPEEIEEIEEVEATVSQAPDPPGFSEMVGRLHVAVIHFPIAWIAITLLLDLLAFGFGRRELEPAGLWTLGMALLSYGPGVSTGLLREDAVAHTDAVRQLVQMHERLILASLAVALVAFLWRWQHRRRLGGGPRTLYLALVTMACLLVLLGAHFGGKVAWGPDHLPF